MALDQFGNYICDIEPVAAPYPASIVGGGDGGATELAFVTGDPNGSETATRPALAYDASGNVWLKTGAGNTNTGWEQKL